MLGYIYKKKSMKKNRYWCLDLSLSEEGIGVRRNENESQSGTPKKKKMTKNQSRKAN